MGGLIWVCAGSASVAIIAFDGVSASGCWVCTTPPDIGALCTAVGMLCTGTVCIPLGAAPALLRVMLKQRHGVWKLSPETISLIKGISPLILYLPVSVEPVNWPVGPALRRDSMGTMQPPRISLLHTR